MKQRFILLLSALLLSCFFLHAKKGRSTQITRLDNVVKKVYVSVEALGTFNFWQNLKKPHGNDGIVFCVTPSVRVDYYLGSYFFVGGGFSFNTTGGKYGFESSLINEIDGFSSDKIAGRRVSVSYLEMPMYVKVQSNYMNKWAVQGILGFSWGLKIRSSYKDIYYNVKYQGKDGQIIFNGAFGKKASLWTVGALVEARALYRATEKFQLFVGTGYQAGLTNTLSKKNTPDEEFHNGKPGQVIVSVGMIF